jgi:hypothetical protein
VRQRWAEKKGAEPTAEDIERIYEKSLTATLEVLPANSHVIEGWRVGPIRNEIGVDTIKHFTTVIHECF